MNRGKSIPSVSVTYARNGSSTRANVLGMRPMQERAYEKRGEQYPRHRRDARPSPALDDFGKYRSASMDGAGPRGNARRSVCRARGRWA